MAYFRRRVTTGLKYHPKLDIKEIAVLIAFGLSITLFISMTSYVVYLAIAFIFEV